jgi:hypothetical protein
VEKGIFLLHLYNNYVHFPDIKREPKSQSYDMVESVLFNPGSADAKQAFHIYAFCCHLVEWHTHSEWLIPDSLLLQLN